MSRPPVRLTRSGLVIDGREEVLLCASLFSFRIPRPQWRSRLEKVRDSGYRAIDLYIPWNHHERSPGVWDFAGDRDVGAFIDLAHEVGLLVIARPGPYICSEWDGGGLPAWLALDRGLRLRQFEPRYLAHVEEWFAHVMPLIALRQYGAGGPVVAVQLENELDFFDCDDRGRYVGALRDLALSSGIRVPLIACAGQGDLHGATGHAEDVIPTVNFYPNDMSPFVESEARHYSAALEDRGLPLLVTETNRRHATLRRLLVSGAKLLAPYLQASGFNHGFTPSVGNWGNPGGFMSHDYDFGGLLSPVGEERAEVADARILAALVRTLGESLAAGRTRAADRTYSIDSATSSAPSLIALNGGGELIGIPNLTHVPAEVTLPARSGVPEVAFTVPAEGCALVLRELPLHPYGIDAFLALATADLIAADEHGLEFVSKTDAVIALRPGPAMQQTSPDDDADVSVEQRGAIVLLRFRTPSINRPMRIAIGDWTITMRHFDDYGPASIDDRVESILTDVREVTAVIQGSVSSHVLPPSAEELAVYRGRVRYAAALENVEELLVAGAGDLVDLSLDGRAAVSLAGFGATARLATAGARRVDATAEIWGHPNFDDARLPALRLGSLRGLGSVWSIVGSTDVSSLWRVQGHWADDLAPLRELGGWSSTRLGDPVTYRRALPIDGTREHALHLGLASGSVNVMVDGSRRTVSADDPWLFLAAGQGRTVSVTGPHTPGLLNGAQLLSLERVTGWRAEAQNDDALIDGVLGPAATTDPRRPDITLPASLSPGEELLFEVSVPPGGLSIRFTGHQVRASAFAAGRLLGRVWLDDPQAPPFTGGDGGRIWLPACWNAGSIRVIVFATPGARTPEFGGIVATPVGE
ncbi:beta-galactosidase [Humibacter ginsengiterrae]